VVVVEVLAVFVEGLATVLEVEATVLFMRFGDGDGALASPAVGAGDAIVVSFAFRFRRLLIGVAAAVPPEAGRVAGAGGEVEVLWPGADGGKAEPLMSLAVERVTLRVGMNK
jgi:hypothetical protein